MFPALLQSLSSEGTSHKRIKQYLFLNIINIITDSFSTFNCKIKAFLAEIEGKYVGGETCNTDAKSYRGRCDLKPHDKLMPPEICFLKFKKRRLEVWKENKCLLGIWLQTTII